MDGYAIYHLDALPEEDDSMSDEQKAKAKELFEMVYKWGAWGVVTNENCYAFKTAIKELLELK